MRVCVECVDQCGKIRLVPGTIMLLWRGLELSTPNLCGIAVSDDHEAPSLDLA